MVITRPAEPTGHGELLLRPAYSEWRTLAQGVHGMAAQWSSSVAGLPIVEARRRARREAVLAAADFSNRLGVPVVEVGSSYGSGIVAMTGCQPELYHPGIWAKAFLLERFSREAGALAIDLVVDSDGFDSIALAAPFFGQEVQRHVHHLVRATMGSYYAAVPVPDARAIEEFCDSVAQTLESLPSSSILRHFEQFCVALDSSIADAQNVAELITFARRRYEFEAGTTYLELPVTVLARTPSFVRFVADIALSAQRFSSAYNAELAKYRSQHGTRSSAQPVPDLKVNGDTYELPLWVLRGGKRYPARVRTNEVDMELLADDETVVRLPRLPEEAIRVLVSVPLAPKALALTMYARVFLADLFIHGVGGGRYDQVTDGIIRSYYGIEPPGYAVASLSMYLPLGVQIVSADEVAAARDRLQRFEHHPDTMLDEVDFETDAERTAVSELVREKAELVRAISQSGADKARLGLRIREINKEIAEILSPFAEHLAREAETARMRLAASKVLRDRTYPFCLWSPSEVADKLW